VLRFYRPNASVKALIPARNKVQITGCSTHNDYLLVFISEQNTVGINATVYAVAAQNIHDLSYGQLCEIIYHHPQNRKYIIYRNTVRGGVSHGHKQHAQKNVRSSVMQISRHVSGYTEFYYIQWAIIKIPKDTTQRLYI